jgi:hypothetical protein
MNRSRSILHLVCLLAVFGVALGAPTRAIEAWVHVFGHGSSVAGLADADHGAGGHALVERQGLPRHPSDHPVDCGTCRELLLVAPCAPWEADPGPCIAERPCGQAMDDPGEVRVLAVFIVSAPPTGPPRS